jgi:hypothetical protein
VGACNIFNDAFEHAGGVEKYMNNDPIEVKDRTVHGHFGRFATMVCAWLGSTWVFAVAGLVIVVWGTTGPVFHSDFPMKKTRTGLTKAEVLGGSHVQLLHYRLSLSSLWKVQPLQYHVVRIASGLPEKVHDPDC